jgi:hypothetical protein
MASSTTEIIIQAVDKASKVFDEIGGKAGSMAKDFAPAADASKKLGLAFLGVGTAAAAFGALTVKAAADAQAEMVVANQAIENTLNSMSAAQLKASDGWVSLGSAMGEVKEHMAEVGNAAVQLGFDDEEASVAFAKLFAVSKSQDQAYKDLSIAQDLARYSGKSLTESAAALTKVHAGATRVLKDFGMEVEEGTTAVQALDMIQAKAGGTAEAYAKSAKGQAEILKIGWQNFTEQIGEKLLPVVTQLLTELNKFVQNGLPEWIDKTGAKFNEISAFLKDHQIIIYAVAGAIAGALVPALVFSLIPAVWGAITAFAAAAIALAPFIIGGAIVGGIVAGIVWIVQNWDMISAKAGEIWNGITETIGGALEATKNWITNVWNSITGFFTQVWETIKGIFMFYLAFNLGLVIMFLDALFPAWRDKLSAIMEWLKTYWEALKIFWQQSLDFISNLWNTMWQGMVDFLVPLWETVTVKVAEGWANLTKQFTEATKPISDAWNNMWEGMKTKTLSVWENIKDGVKAGINWIIEKINYFIDKANEIARTGSVIPGVSVPQISRIPQLAEGGIVRRPTLAMIGEAGPEAVVPLGKNKGLGSSVTINITGNTLLDNQAAEKMGDLIIKKLMLTQRLAA